MSLSDLRQHYSPERTVEERLKLLEVASTHLPAPEFLWLPVALEALGSTELVLRRAAMRLLAFAPQTWDQVLVVALTNADAELQRSAIAALATQARAWPELVEAFGSLGQLPGWLPESLEVCRQAQELLKPAEPQPDEALSAMRAQLDSERATWQARLADAQHAREAIARQLATVQESTTQLEASIEAERRGAQDIGARLERLIAVHDAEVEQRDRDRDAYESLQRRHRLVMMGSAAAVALLVLVGGPIAWTLGSQKTAPAVMAASMPYPPAELEAELEAAEDAGYRRALASLANHADKLAKAGHLYPAVAAWQAYAQLAPTPNDAKAGVQASETLLAKIQKTTPASQFKQLTAKRPRTLDRHVKPTQVVAKTATVRSLTPASAHRAVRKAPVRAHAVPVAPPVLPSPAGAPAIPDQVRAKF